MHLTAAFVRTQDRLRLLWLPRVNLAVIRWSIRNADRQSEVLKWNLPYEMICVAVL